MKKQLLNFMWLCLAIVLNLMSTSEVKATQLVGTYTIDTNGTPSATVFRNFNSAITYLTSADARSDGGPSNSAPFGVSGQVIFDVAFGTYVEQVSIPAIPGASDSTRIIFNGNRAVLQFAPTTSLLHVLRLQGADYITIRNLIIRTTSTANGWGIHFFQGADFNIIDSCEIDLSVVTSSSSTTNAGIVFSNSLTSPTTSGVNGYDNTVRNCLIRGNTTSSGMYYGIVGFPATTGTTPSRNKFINNTIQDFFIYGIYWGNSNRTLWRKNLLRRTTKASVSTTYGFYFTGSSRLDTLDGNMITGMFNAAPTNGNQFFGVYAINYSGTTTEPHTFYNNVIYNNRGIGSQYGFYMLSATNVQFYNNTISFDNTAATSTSQQIYGYYINTSINTSSRLDFRNNIINITQGGTGPKYAMYFAGTATSGATINKNGYFSNAANYNAVFHNGTNYPTYASWRSFIATQDQNSNDFNPNFTNFANGDLRPREAWYSRNADTIPFITSDYTGNARTLPMDIGAYNANPILLDVAMMGLGMPISPYLAGTQNITATIRNAGATAITSATINWTVNGVSQTPFSFSGNLAPGGVSAPLALGNVSIANGVLYTISATVSNPNNQPDPITNNNTVSAQTASAVPGGTYTVNAAGSGTSNFTSLSTFANIASLGGISGPITINFVANSGPYTEQVFFRNIIGANSTNSITINGNGERVQFDNTDFNSLGIINVIGTRNMTFNNLGVRSLNLNNGIGYLLTAGADSTQILNCIIDISSVLGGSSSAGIAVTGALNSPTSTGLNGRFCRFEGNTIIGGATGGPFYGISLIPTNLFNGPNTFNIVRNNIIRDFTVYGIYMSNTAGTLISRNEFSRPSKTSPTTFYGVYLVSSAQQDTIENNIITHSHGTNPSLNFTQYGIYPIATNTQSTRPVIYRNNLITNLRGTGSTYAFYSLSSTNYRFLHNTIALEDPTSTSTNVTYAYYSSGSPTNQHIRNNILYINKGGTGSKVAVYLDAVSATGYLIGNNDYHVKRPGSATNVNLGFYNGALRPTLSDWTTNVTFDLNSTNADPKFRTFLTATPFMPGSDSLNRKGAFVRPDVPRDITGALRDSIPDMGVYEFVVPGADVGLTKIVAPTISQVALNSSVNLEVQLKNFGANTLTGATINWRVDTALQTPSNWFGSLVPEDTANHIVGSYFVGASGIYPITIWSSSPNSVVDSFPQNDTLRMVVCTPISGNFTINPSAPSSSTNYRSVADMAFVLSNCGVNGPVTVRMAAGTYNEFMNLANIIGSSATNTITFLGSDSTATTITYNGAVQRPTLLLNGAKNITFRKIRFVTTGSAAGTAVQLTNQADSNTFVQCEFIAPVSNQLAVNAFVASGSIVGPTTIGNSANYLLIDSCFASGGFHAINLYGTTSPKSVGNIIRNSTVQNSHQYGIYVNFQNSVQITNNRALTIGVPLLNTSTAAASISVYNSDSSIRVTHNEVQGMFAGRGIEMVANIGSAVNKMVVANNMINTGQLANVNYGIFENNNGHADFAYNTVKLNTSEPNYIGAALYSNNTNTFTYNTIRIVNNIFTAPVGALTVYIVTPANLVTANYTIDNNVYFSTNTNPFRVQNFITNSLVTFATGTPNMLGTFLPGNNVRSQFFMPTFYSATNLRSISPELDDSARAITSVTTDYDGRPRSVTAPDIGLTEFTKPAADAGVIAILEPRKPMINGLQDIRVVVKNFGVNTLTSMNVNYKVDTTATRTRVYTGTLAANATDTIRFDSLSGPNNTSQQFNFTGNLVTIRAWTSLPNNTVDSVNINDSTILPICGSLSGNYTINAAGSGTSNFTSLQAAIDKLACGGISGPVVFTMSSGTYSGQFSIGAISGTDTTRTVTFRSATGNPQDVTITTNTSTAVDNYTLRLMGTQFTRFQNITLSNSHPTFGVVVSINKDANTNTNVSEVSFRGCNFIGVNTTSTATQYALVFGPAGDNATFLTFANSNFTNGSFGIWLGGQSIVNQNAPGLNIDSNTFTNQYYAPIWLSNRFLTNIRRNMITCHSSYFGSYAIYISGFGQQSEISYNTIINPVGYYGIFISQNAYYDAPGITRIKNNLLHMQGTSLNYGIFITTSNKIHILSNTVRLNSTQPTSSFAFYLSGHTSFVNGTTTYPATYDIQVRNNIFNSVNGYSVYTTNIQANQGLTSIGHNLYFSGGTTPFFMAGVTHTPAQFYTNYRGYFHANSDRKSLWGNVNFTSGTNFTVDPAHESVWLVNGRAQHNGFVNDDINGAPRSTTVAAGVPDIGAHELAPTATPPAATLTGSINFATPQHIVDQADTIGTITWGFSGTLPTGVTARYYPGSLVSHGGLFRMTNTTNRMDAFIGLQANGGSFYSYDFTFRYDSAYLGTVNSESDLKLTLRTDTITWTNFAGFLTTVDTTLKRFSAVGLSSISSITGTDDIRPLPVRLTSFAVNRKGQDAEISWTTAAEVNASHFVIERSVDNRNYTEVARVRAAGNTRETTRYQHVDASVPRNVGANTVYYRLRSVDMDATSALSQIRRVSFDDIRTKEPIRTFPNPFRDYVNITIVGEMDQEAKVEVYDIYGKLIFTKGYTIYAGANDLTIDQLANLTTGVYLVKVKVNGTELANKLIKE
jgi:hypothetical protein